MKYYTPIALTILFSGFCLSASAGWLLLDDFADGNTTGWTTRFPGGTSVVSDAGNNVMQVVDNQQPGANLVTFSLPTPVTGQGTVFWRIYALDDPTTNIGWNLGKGTTLNDRNVTFGHDKPGAFEWFVWNGSTQLEVTQTASFAPATWYNLWMTFDAGAPDTFSVYVQGGAFATQTQLATSGPSTTWGLRNTPVSSISHLMLTAASSDDAATAGLRVDDIYIDTTGYNLAVVPEPSSLLLMVGGLGAFLLRRMARSMAPPQTFPS